MKQFRFLTDANREIYVNLGDVLHAIKDNIDGARLDGLDTTVAEIIFVFFGEKHEEIETRLKAEIAARINEQRPELERKYQNILKRISPEPAAVGDSSEVVSNQMENPTPSEG